VTLDPHSPHLMRPGNGRANSVCGRGLEGLVEDLLHGVKFRLGDHGIVMALVPIAAALRVAESRPSAEHGLGQFHMTADSLAEQFLALKPYFIGQRIIVLGDDDHLSLLIAKYTDARVTVIETDERVCANLNGWMG